MIIVKLKGGLGNQIFQYVAARSISNYTKISLDFSFLNNNYLSTDRFTARQFELGIFDKLEIVACNKYFIKLIKSKKSIARAITPKYTYVTDDNIHEFLDKQHKNIYLDGYFQNPLIFQNIRNSLLNELTFPILKDKENETELKITNSVNSVAIHIRRGDYTKPEIGSIHGILPMEYYLSCIKIIESKVQNPFFYIFSDDPKWCHENFSFLKNKEIISGNHQAWIDMCLISKCKHQIIANSSFSWWGAWLNENPEKLVITPKNWLITEHIDTKNLIPSNWIRI